MRIQAILKIIAAAVAYSVYASAKLLPYQINTIMSQLHPIVTLMTLANLVGWLCGLTAVVLLLLSRPPAKWFLGSYLIMGILGTSVSWIPFTGVLMDGIDSPYAKMTLNYLINLCVLVLVFLLFHKMKRVEETQVAAL